jgi:hypothetical protein
MATDNDVSVTVIHIVLYWLRQTVLAALVIAVLIYVGDFAIFFLRGKPHDQIVVSRYLAAPLKGNKTEYYFEGTGPMDCARALFPQAGWSPCWYLRRHTLYSEKL